MGQQLAGTDAQVAWGETLRQSFLADVSRIAAESRFGDIYRTRAAELAESQTEARWWIEHRNIDPRRILRTRLERVGELQAGEDSWTPARGIAEY